MTGFSTKGFIGFAPESSGGTAATPDHYLLALSENFSLEINRFEYTNIHGKFSEPDDMAGTRQITGNISVPSMPIAVGHFLEGVMGTRLYSSLGNGLYRYDFTMTNNDWDEVFANQPYTFEIFRDVTSSQQYTGVCFNQLEMQVSPNQDLRLNATLIGRDSTNIAASNVTYPNSPTQPFAFDTCSVSIAGAGSALVEDLTVTINNQLEAVPSLRNSTDIRAIRRTGPQLIRLSGQIAFESVTEYDKFINQSEQRFRLNFTRADSFSLEIDLPRTVYTAFPLQMQDRGRQQVGFEAMARYSTNSAYAVEIKLTTTSLGLTPTNTSYQNFISTVVSGYNALYLAAWDEDTLFSALSGTTQSNSGDIVQRFEDKLGGPGYAWQAGTSNAPIYGATSEGYPCLHFDGASAFMAVNSFTSSAGDYTAIFCFKSSSLEASQDQWLFDTASGRLVFAHNAVNSDTGYFDSADWQTRPLPMNERKQVLTFVLSGGGGEIRRNGVSMGGDTYNPVGIGGTTALFSSSSFGGAFAKGDLSAMFLINRALSRDELRSAELELAEHFGLVGTLSGDIQRFVAIGDSITAGALDDIESDNTSDDSRTCSLGYPPILNNLLSQDGRGYSIANEGVGGRTTLELLNNMSAIMSRNIDADAYLCGIGINDTEGTVLDSGEGLNPGDAGYTGSYKDYLQQIVDLVHGQGKSIYLGYVTAAKGVEAHRNTTSQAYNRVIDEIVAAEGITVVPPDFYTHFSNNTDEYGDDLHPNGTGYQSMAQLWYNALTA